MLPEDLALVPGEERIRVCHNMGDTDFRTPERLRRWAETHDVGGVYLVMYFAHDNSGTIWHGVQSRAYVDDRGTYVAIRALGEGDWVIDAVLAAIKARAKTLQRHS